MRIAFFDCFAGIAGDMTVAALLDAGLDFDYLQAELRKLRVEGYELRRSKTRRHHIAATRFDVILHRQVPYHTHATSADFPQHTHADHPHDHGPDDHHAQGTGRGHHDPDDGGPSPRERDHSVPLAAHVHRRLSDVVELIQRARFSQGAEKNAISVFKRLAEAEASVHGTDPEEVHFHEVGAVDAIVDVVGTCLGIEAMGIEEVHASAIRTGIGTIRAAHGVMPVPAPGTLELLRGVPIDRTSLPYELVTPTGAAIITTLAKSFACPPVFVPDAIGYGAGSRDTQEIANLLRVEIGRTTGSAGEERALVVETTIDDMTPEVYGYVLERLFEAGAKDVYLSPVIMKKNRPGIVVHVLVHPERRERVVSVLFGETSTLGVRISDVVRRVLPRRSETVETPWGPVRVKCAEWDGRTRTTPEYDDCAAIARARNIPVLEVYEFVRKAAEEFR
ncbi:MAG: hypothetical protein BWY06_00553 [Candidatus Latescibacteria bacterium ADurb.Bin168]|nr:MAG: hypothetical protein BWY06_00553 [Candidatus Latescibacteria bacterium ADurb.Bin168]